MLIPMSALTPANKIKPGNTIGFELQIDTGTNVFYTWACQDPKARVSMQPNLWGEALLAGADARIELLDARKKSALTFRPGEPLTVRVTDADLNLNPSKKVGLSVTLRSRSGDVRLLPLAESPYGSGVFIGTIPTRISTGVRTDRVFEVLAGEDIQVEYRDLLTADGRRDAPVSATFKAAR
jgi:hypothetical protein